LTVVACPSRSSLRVPELVYQMLVAPLALVTARSLPPGEKIASVTFAPVPGSV
jgi:hypothetical protein